MNDFNELSKKVRIHKHNYAGEFGNVAIDPIKSLVDELIANPEVFSKSERADIIDEYSKTLQIKGIYGILGYDINEQLAKVKEEMIPQIRSTSQLLQKIISKERHFSTPYLIEIINWANSYSDDLCDKLNKIEHDDKGEAVAIPIINIIEREFEEDGKTRRRKGLASFDFSISGKRECSDTKVFLDPDGFKNNVIGNIIQNIHKHAFSYNATRNTPIGKHGFFSNLLWPFFSRINGSLTDPSDRQVRIKFLQEGTFVKVVIENNGKPFPADMDTRKIFEYKVSSDSGEGIGLYSAADFLKKYGATIDAVSTPDNKFTVHFIIKIPVYGTQV